MIVAWHEVPGTKPPQKSRHVGYGVICAGVDADSLSFFGRKAFQQQVIQLDETAEQLPRRVEPDRKPRLGEIDLHHVSAFLETAPDFALLLAEQVVEILFPRITGYLFLRIEKAQRRGRGDRLLDRYVGIALDRI